MTRRLPMLGSLLMVLYSSSTIAAPPTMSRDEIITIAKTGVGCPYVWGGTCWDPNNKKWKGADCSGYVTVCWQIPKASKTTDCLSHYYSTYHYTSQTTHWTNISRNDLQKADALVYRENGAGHIVLYVSGDKWGTAEVYEARGTAYGIMHRMKSVSSKYKARRRNYLKNSTPPPTNKPPTGELTKADCKMVSGWAQDPDEKTKSIEVHLYVDGTPGQAGVTQHKLKADKYDAKLCTSLGSCNHAFTWTVPASLKDGKQHTFRAYGVDTKGGQNPELTNSPKKITCTVNPPPKDLTPPAADTGATKPKLDSGTKPPPSTDTFLPPSADLGGLPPSASPRDLYTLQGGCGVSGGGHDGWPLVLVLLLMWRGRRRGNSSAW